MALEAQDIARLDALLAALGGEADAGRLSFALQRLLPSFAVRQCDASDVLEEPFRAAGACELHLLDTSSHCIRVIEDPREATGILLAGRIAA